MIDKDNPFKIGDTVTVVNAPDMPHWLGLTGKVIQVGMNQIMFKGETGVKHGPMNVSRFIEHSTPVTEWLKK